MIRAERRFRHSRLIAESYEGNNVTNIKVGVADPRGRLAAAARTACCCWVVPPGVSLLPAACVDYVLTDV